MCYFLECMSLPRMCNRLPRGRLKTGLFRRILQGGKREAPTHQVVFTPVPVPSKYLTDVSNNVLER